MSERASGPTPTPQLVRLGAELRARGVRAGVGELLGAHRALGAVDPADREQAYLALRAVLCSRRADLDEFEEAFVVCFGEGARVRPGPPSALDDVAGLVLPRAAVPGERVSRPGEVDVVPSAWSDVELLRGKDFAAYTEAERAAARRLLRELAVRGPRRRSRRTRPSRRRRGVRPDLRRTVRSSLRWFGEPLERHWRAPATRPRPLVLVCDVSGSMEPYARMLLQYLQACVAARAQVEAFVFGTRLTRVTRELRGRDPDRALARAARAVADWSGGTRIGSALAQLNREHGRQLGRGAVVVLLSDGWDRGDPDELAAEMARLRRSSHALIWLNPLKAAPGYEPLTRGMVAALPYVDHLLAGNSIRSLQELADLLQSEVSQ